MKSDHILAFAAFATMAAYLVVLVGFVPLADMTVVIAFCIALAAYDFWQQLWGKRRG